jgi:hypothetical protein
MNSIWWVRTVDDLRCWVESLDLVNLQLAEKDLELWVKSVFDQDD